MDKCELIVNPDRTGTVITSEYSRLNLNTKLKISVTFNMNSKLSSAPDSTWLRNSPSDVNSTWTRNSNSATNSSRQENKKDFFLKNLIYI